MLFLIKISKFDSFYMKFAKSSFFDWFRQNSKVFCALITCVMISGSSIALELSQCVVVPSVCRLSSLAGRCVLSVRRPLSSLQSLILASLADFIICAWAVHSACALATAGSCSTPVRHISRITWYPPGMIALEHQWIKALILDKLLAVCGDTGETGELQKICFLVLNDTRIRSWIFKSNPASAFCLHCCDLWRSRQLHSCPSCHRPRYKVTRVLHHLDQWGKYHFTL